MSLPIINTISFTLMGVTIPVFIFAVTLLGNAINKAHQEENDAKKKEKEDFDFKINNLENKIKAAKQTGDSSGFEVQLKEILSHKKEFDKQVKKIRYKYSLIELKQCILFPASFFILSILSNEIPNVYFSPPIIAPIFWILSLSFLSFGIFRLYQSLSLIQHVSVSSEELQIKKMTDAFSTALDEHDKKKEGKLYINFTDIKFPYISKPEEELSIKFRVGIEKGLMINNVSIWFFIPDEFGLIDPDEEKSWRQASDFGMPNIRTVEFKLGNISIGPYSKATLKVKSPYAEGVYSLSYRASGDAYRDEINDINIIVKAKDNKA